MKTTFKMTGWKKLKTIFSPADFSAVLVPNLRKATAYNALLVKKEIRQRIVDMKYSPNANLTIMLKGASKPLVGIDSALFNGVTTVVVNEKTAFVGVLRQARQGNQNGLANLAEMLHEGMTIQVTEKMRNLFLLLYEMSLKHGPGRDAKGRFTKAASADQTIMTGRAAELWEQLGGKGVIYPIKPETQTIVIKGRPFIQEVIEDPALLAKCKENWAKAVAFSIHKAVNTSGG
jgi:hypothetical protein